MREDVVSFPDLVEPVEAFPSCPEIVPDTGWRIGEGHQGEIRTLAAPETCPDPSVPGMDQIQASAGAEGVGSGEHCARAWGDRGELVMEMTATPSMHASPPESLEEDPVVGGISAPQLCAGSLAVTAGTVPTRRGDALMLAFSQAAGVLARRGTVWLQPPSKQLEGQHEPMLVEPVILCALRLISLASARLADCIDRLDRAFVSIQRKRTPRSSLCSAI